MKLTVIATAGHQGKSLVVDAEQETINVHDASGQLMGNMPWGKIIEQVLANPDDGRFAHCRTQPRAPLAVKVRYTTPQGKHFDSITGGVGGGGLFIESGAPLAPGTELTVEFALPDRPWEKLKANAKVAWIRTKAERYLLFPGMGVQFLEIDEKSRHQLIELVEALNRSRNPS